MLQLSSNWSLAFALAFLIHGHLKLYLSLAQMNTSNVCSTSTCKKGKCSSCNKCKRKSCPNACTCKSHSKKATRTGIDGANLVLGKRSRRQTTSGRLQTTAHDLIDEDESSTAPSKEAQLKDFWELFGWSRDWAKNLCSKQKRQRVLYASLDNRTKATAVEYTNLATRFVAERILPGCSKTLVKAAAAKVVLGRRANAAQRVLKYLLAALKKARRNSILARTCRAILKRALSLDEIKKLKEEQSVKAMVGDDLEAFIYYDEELRFVISSSSYLNYPTFIIQ